MRYQKVIKTDGVETSRYDYVYSEGTLVLITYTADGVSDTARFIYDSYGEPRGFILNNTAAYLYIKNAQGDITAIVNENGEVILTCTYDAWGNVNFGSTSMTHMTLAAKLSQINPFTYRGYCYDYDIGVYYLQSRYYDPEICRFINTDDTNYLNTTGTVLGCNLFAYCENDGVNCLDETGKSIEISADKNKELYAKKVFGYLKKITDDTLKYNKGKISITKKCTKQKMKKFYGTLLLRNLLDSSYIVTISAINQKGNPQTLAENYKRSLIVFKNGISVRGSGSHSIIYFYLKYKSKSQDTPLYIVLAHELIHAYRDISGMSINHKKECSAHGGCALEECLVVGLHTSRKLRLYQVMYTENIIRSENGLIKRTTYNGW